jgi:hypothetical protein
MASATLEKPTATHGDIGHDVEMDVLKDNVGTHFTAQQTKALLRKIDWHLIPFLSLLYLLSFLE